VFDHVTFRVEDLPSAATSLKAVLGELGIAQSRETVRFAVWGNLALTQHDDDHPITRNSVYEGRASDGGQHHMGLDRVAFTR
jgi:hypothetical protein